MVKALRSRFLGLCMYTLLTLMSEWLMVMVREGGGWGEYGGDGGG